MKLLRLFAAGLALLASPLAAQSVKVVDPTTGLPVFSAATPAPVTIISSATGASATQVQGNVASGATDSGNPVKAGARTIVDTTAAGYTANQRGDLIVDGSGGLKALVTEPVTVTDATSNISAMRFSGGWGYPLNVAGMAYNGTNWDRIRGDTNGSWMVPKPVTSGGLLISRLINATSGVVKASAGQLYTGTLTNSNAAIRYLEIYNKATAGTLSTDTPVMTIPLPPNATVMVDFSGLGGAFATGISWQFTTDDIAIPTTAGATTDIHGFLTYK